MQERRACIDPRQAADASLPFDDIGRQLSVMGNSIWSSHPNDGYSRNKPNTKEDTLMKTITFAALAIAAATALAMPAFASDDDGRGYRERERHGEYSDRRDDDRDHASRYRKHGNESQSDNDDDDRGRHHRRGPRS